MQKNANHVSNSTRKMGSKSAGQKHHLEPEIQQVCVGGCGFPVGSTGSSTGRVLGLGH